MRLLYVPPRMRGLVGQVPASGSRFIDFDNRGTWGTGSKTNLAPPAGMYWITATCENPEVEVELYARTDAIHLVSSGVGDLSTTIEVVRDGYIYFGLRGDFAPGMKLLVTITEASPPPLSSDLVHLLVDAVRRWWT